MVICVKDNHGYLCEKAFVVICVKDIHGYLCENIFVVIRVKAILYIKELQIDFCH